MTESPRDRFHIFLVEPEDSLNIGATARAMTNLGFRHLHLVAPVNYDRERARITACWGEPLLDTLQLHDNFPEAIAGMEEVIGFSGRESRNPAHHRTLPEWSHELPTRPLHKTALLFGSEVNGLGQEHLNQCRQILRIPSTTENSSFNLAQSVLLTCYEITRSLPDTAPTVPSNPLLPPTWNDLYQLDRLLDSVMQTSGFVRNGTPRPVPDIIKNLFRRLELTPQERGILLGFFGKIDRTLLRNAFAVDPETETANHETVSE